MRHALILPLLILAACAATPVQREMQYAEGIKTIQRATITAVDFDLITIPDAEAIQAVLRTATADLRRAIAARRAGVPMQEWSRILAIVDDALTRVEAILARKGK